AVVVGPEDGAGDRGPKLGPGEVALGLGPVGGRGVALAQQADAGEILAVDVLADDAGKDAGGDERSLGSAEGDLVRAGAGVGVELMGAGPEPSRFVAAALFAGEFPALALLGGGVEAGCAGAGLLAGGLAGLIDDLGERLGLFQQE